MESDNMMIIEEDLAANTECDIDSRANEHSNLDQDQRNGILESENNELEIEESESEKEVARLAVLAAEKIMHHKVWR